MYTYILLTAGLALAGDVMNAASGGQPSSSKAADALPKHYVCYRTGTPITVDGRLDEPAWNVAPWTDDFEDIEGAANPRPRFRTRAKMLWDDQYLYIGAELEEPHVWANLTQHDQIVFNDPDFEIFIDPNGDRREYCEIEVNARNTIFDLFLVRTYIEGGPALHAWDCKGLRSAVYVDGTLNDPRDRDRGWTVEFADRWRHMAHELLARRMENPRGRQSERSRRPSRENVRETPEHAGRQLGLVTAGRSGYAPTRALGLHQLLHANRRD
jgi:hypothetical protein